MRLNVERERCKREWDSALSQNLHEADKLVVCHDVLREIAVKELFFFFISVETWNDYIVQKIVGFFLLSA